MELVCDLKNEHWILICDVSSLACKKVVSVFVFVFVSMFVFG